MNQRSIPLITIDGPMAVGKHSVARKLQHGRSIVYFSFDRLREALALHAIARNISPDDTAALVALTATLTRYDSDHQTARTQPQKPAVTTYADDIRRDPAVHDALADKMRTLVADLPTKTTRCIVVTGRAAGSELFPEATLKVFLDAPAAVRVRRLLQREGKQLDQTAAETALTSRDLPDMRRTFGRLAPAKDAVMIDTAKHNPSDTAREIVRLLGEKTGLKKGFAALAKLKTPPAALHSHPTPSKPTLT